MVSGKFFLLLLFKHMSCWTSCHTVSIQVVVVVAKQMFIFYIICLFILFIFYLEF